MTHFFYFEFLFLLLKFRVLVTGNKEQSGDAKLHGNFYCAVRSHVLLVLGLELGYLLLVLLYKLNPYTYSTVLHQTVLY